MWPAEGDGRGRARGCSMSDNHDSTRDRAARRLKIERNTIQWRLKLWGRWVQQDKQHFAHYSSVFGRIREMQDNAGIHGDGIRYELIEVDGESVMCPPDGGLSRAVERQAADLLHDIRCRETHAAVSMLPDAMRRTIIAVYVVPAREQPRSARRAAEKLSINHKTVLEALKTAHERVAREVYGPFEIIGSEATSLTETPPIA